MAKSVYLLEQLIRPLPDDISEYFGSLDASLTVEWIGLYDAQKALEESLDFRSFHPIVEKFGGIILDDSNTSNHHLYLTVRPLNGMVMILDHDGSSRIVFESLFGFLSAARLAAAKKDYVEKLHPSESPLCRDQVALNALIESLLDDPDAGTLISALVPSLELTTSPVANALASHDDNYVSEAIAEAIVRKPSQELHDLAVLRSIHPHGQARNTGQRALAALAALLD
jgi:hypothetical protein